MFDRNAELRRRQNELLAKEKLQLQQQRHATARAKRDEQLRSRDQACRNEYELRMATAERRIDLLDRQKNSARSSQLATPRATIPQSQAAETTIHARPVSAKISNNLYHRLLGQSFSRILESSRKTDE